MKLPRLKDKIAFLRQSQFQTLPLIYVIKDKKGRFQFMTEIAAQHAGANSADELNNLTISDLPCDAADFSDDFYHYENMTMYQRSETLLLSLIHSAQGAKISLICNKPIINNRGEVEGVETWAQILPSATGLDKIIQGYQHISLDDSMNQPSNSKVLTLREQECVHYLTRGFTFPEIANKLLISPRTVETHVTNIKIKLGVKTRAELIVRVCELGYLQIKPLDPNIKPGKLQLLDLKPSEALEEIIS
jgi:DNA-binding CsgD family transcriptional regulator